MKINKQLTSVKVDPQLFEEFKMASIRTKINLQKLVDRSLYLYLTDQNFRSTINNQLNISLSGSTLL